MHFLFFSFWRHLLEKSLKVIGFRLNLISLGLGDTVGNVVDISYNAITLRYNIIVQLWLFTAFWKTFISFTSPYHNILFLRGRFLWHFSFSTTPSFLQLVLKILIWNFGQCSHRNHLHIYLMCPDPLFANSLYECDFKMVKIKMIKF